MTFGRKNAEVAEGVSIVSDSLLITAIAFCIYSSKFVPCATLCNLRSRRPRPDKHVPFLVYVIVRSFGQ